MTDTKTFNERLDYGLQLELSAHRYFDAYQCYHFPLPHYHEGRPTPDCLLTDHHGTVIYAEAKRRKAWYVKECGTGFCWYKWRSYKRLWKEQNATIWIIFEMTGDHPGVFKISVETLSDYEPKKVPQKKGKSLAIWPIAFVERHRIQ